MRVQLGQLGPGHRQPVDAPVVPDRQPRACPTGDAVAATRAAEHQLVSAAALQAAGHREGDRLGHRQRPDAGVALGPILVAGSEPARVIDRLDWAGEALRRHGATIIVVARFVPGGRTATTFTAGTVRLPWPRFAAADAVGASLWAAYAAGLGYLGGETFERRPLYALLFGLGVALLVALVVEAARRLRRRAA